MSVDYKMIEIYLQCPDKDSIKPVDDQLSIENISKFIGFEAQIVNGMNLAL